MQIFIELKKNQLISIKNSYNINNYYYSSLRKNINYLFIGLNLIEV